MKVGNELLELHFAEVTEATTPTAFASGDHAVSVCLVCCSSKLMSRNVIHALSDAMSPLASVQTIIFSESTDGLHGGDVVTVPQETKLSKIRRLSDLIETDLVCICDPDVTIDEENCRLVFGKAVAEIRKQNDVVAFGIIAGKNDGTLLSRVIAVDKWLSHRVLRRFLWRIGIGITLPGQFLIVSTELLRRINPNVDSYLDDLYLGWLARREGVRVHRVPVIVGEEESRTKWSSLATQRVRWMKGLAYLFGHLATYPSAISLLSLHYLAYHGLPILVFIGIALLALSSPFHAVAVFLGIALVIARLSGQSISTAATYLVVFPAVHIVATLFWWIPVSRAYLARR